MILKKGGSKNERAVVTGLAEDAVFFLAATQRTINSLPPPLSRICTSCYPFVVVWFPCLFSLVLYIRYGFLISVACNDTSYVSQKIYQDLLRYICTNSTPPTHLIYSNAFPQKVNGNTSREFLIVLCNQSVYSPFYFQKIPNNFQLHSMGDFLGSPLLYKTDQTAYVEVSPSV